MKSQRPHVIPPIVVGLRKLTAGAVVPFFTFVNAIAPIVATDGMDRKEYRTRKFGNWEHSQKLDSPVVQAGAEVGLQFNYDEITRTPNTLPGHKLLWLAAELGVQDAVAEGLFAVYFTEGRDVGDATVLLDVGMKAGIEEARISNALSSEEVATQVMLEEESVKKLEIHGVPSLVVAGRVLHSGAHHEEIFARELQVHLGLHWERRSGETDRISTQSCAIGNQIRCNLVALFLRMGGNWEFAPRN